jgi:protein-disulfide isomerase
MILLRSLLVAALVVTVFTYAGHAQTGTQSPPGQTDDDVLSRDAVLRDAEIPVAGNPSGDITIVEYFDFQCPYCRKVHADLQQLMKEDRQVRVIYKDWPILGEVSAAAARLVQGAKYQGKFVQAHDALMNYKGRLTAGNLEEILTKAGVDVAKAKADAQTNDAAIKATLARNNAQAEAFGFFATPSFIVGTFRVPGVLELAMFKQAIKEARELQKKQGN